MPTEQPSRNLESPKFHIPLSFFFKCFVDRASLYNVLNKANLVHNLFLVYLSLHVSGDYVPIIMRNNCADTTLDTCYSVWLTV